MASKSGSGGSSVITGTSMGTGAEVPPSDSRVWNSRRSCSSRASTSMACPVVPLVKSSVSAVTVQLVSTMGLEICSSAWVMEAGVWEKESWTSTSLDCPARAERKRKPPAAAPPFWLSFQAASTAPEISALRASPETVKVLPLQVKSAERAESRAGSSASSLAWASSRVKLPTWMPLMRVLGSSFPLVAA